MVSFCGDMVLGVFSVFEVFYVGSCGGFFVLDLGFVSFYSGFGNGGFVFGVEGFGVLVGMVVFDDCDFGFDFLVLDLIVFVVVIIWVFFECVVFLFVFSGCFMVNGVLGLFFVGVWCSSGVGIFCYLFMLFELGGFCLEFLLFCCGVLDLVGVLFW